MKKLWAIAVVIGFTAFWTYGFLIASGLFGGREGHPMNYVLCILGLGVGLFARQRVLSATPKMHGRRAAARARLDAEVEESLV
ncbi:MAG: hypothetical protein ACPGNV_09900 [Mangrovicoccus sp.]